MLKELLRRRTKFDPIDLAAFIRTAYHYILNREADGEGYRHFHDGLRSGLISPSSFIETLFGSAEHQVQAGSVDNRCPLKALHRSRQILVRQLPKADTIVDLGGAADGSSLGAMIVMGYPYPFKTLTIVEPPRERRHDCYKDVVGDLTEIDSGRGLVKYLFESMTNLESIPDRSVNLVFSGESFEHITREEGERVMAEVRRMLKPGGSFCFDTPNRALTRIQMGDKFIHDDHKYEYTNAELTEMLTRHGFDIVEARGVTWMPRSVATRQILYDEMVENIGLFDDIENCYLLYYRAK